MELHIYIDGSSLGNPGKAGAGFLIKNGKGEEVLRGGKSLGRMTNNMAEYEALILALEKAVSLSYEKIFVYTDSLLLFNQIEGRFKVKDCKLKERFKKVTELLQKFPNFELKYIPREENKEADRIAKEASGRGKCVVAGFKPEESPGIVGQDGP